MIYRNIKFLIIVIIYQYYSKKYNVLIISEYELNGAMGKVEPVRGRDMRHRSNYSCFFEQ